ncbi:MAG TPA: peptidylprolyl isomerase [Vitreimonas sp.]|uniref:peptidylprolyl isomerase n=1 Tax=Vitreimonas sp. TaxID=3069702 RepID=UPI002D6D46F1|nr:peptidylprolyl isomerase [Vitreimonas sp.]HYD87644.1 peptidylprolyl isomerase [Vitreimonas sp.]
MASLKRVPLKAVFFVAALALAGCGLGRDAGSDNAGVRDPIVAATVNGRPIYVEDVRNYAVSRGWIAETEDLDANSDAANLALEELIQIRLFAMEAEARGLDRQPDIRRQLENARERVLAAAIYEEIAQKAADPETIERLYRENSSRLGQGDEVHLRHMQFTTREAADAAKRRLDQGERFEALAFELSVERNTAPDGGDLGFRAIADLTPQMRQEVERTATGQLIGPIQIEDSWHLFRVDDRRTIGGPSLEQLRPRITAWLAYQESTQLTERLARDARIERLRETEQGMEPAGEVTAPADAQPAQPRPEPSAPPQTGAPPPPFPFPNATPPPAATNAAPAPAPQPQEVAPGVASPPETPVETPAEEAGPTQ